VKLQTHDEPLMVNAFGQGVMAGPFSDSLIRNSVVTFVEIRCQVVAHISAEEVVYMKHNNTYPWQTKPKKGSRARPVRINEAMTEKRMDARRAPYPTRKNVAKVKVREGCRLLSFLDAFSGYNKIRMHLRDESKTAFMTELSNYCYKVMPFSLKNASAIY